MERQIKQVESLVAASHGQYQQAQGLIANFDDRLRSAEASAAAQKTATDAVATQLSDVRETIASVERYASRLQLRAINTFGMPEDVWTATPNTVKHDIVVWSQSKTNGVYLLCLTVALFLVSVIMPSLLALSPSVDFARYHNLFTPLVPVPPLLLLIFLTALPWFGRRLEAEPAMMKSPEYSPAAAPDERWRDYEPSIRSAAETPIEILSFKVAREYFLASLVLLTLNVCLLIPEARRFIDLFSGRT
jgi:hypothetical protein